MFGGYRGECTYAGHWGGKEGKVNKGRYVQLCLNVLWGFERVACVAGRGADAVQADVVQDREEVLDRFGREDGAKGRWREDLTAVRGGL